jgi:hypothetical protein
LIFLRTVQEGKEIEVEVYGDELFARCYNCGEEIPVDEELLFEILKDGCGIAGTSLSCCGEIKPKLTIVK